MGYLAEEMILLISKKAPVKRTLIYVLTMTMIALPLSVTALRMIYVLSRPDTRTLAGEWVKNNLPEDTVVITNFLPHELHRSDTSRLWQQADYPGSLGLIDEWYLENDLARNAGPTYHIILAYISTRRLLCLYCLDR